MSLLTYTFANLKAAAKHAGAVQGSGNDFDTGNDAATIVNDALAFLQQDYDWSWLKKPFALSFSAVAITSLVRASDVVTVTKTAHGLSIGDPVRITGSSATVNSFDGEYIVATVPTADTFTVNQSGADETANTPGSYILGFVTFASDFNGLLDIQRNSRIRGMFPASMDRINRFRTAGGILFGGPVGFHYALRTVGQASVSASPTTRLELFPTPTEAETAAIIGTYRRLLPTLSSDNDLPDVPSFCMPLLRTLVRAWAVSTEEERAGEDWRRYERMKQTAIQRDSSESSNLGMLEGGIDDPMSTVDHLYPVNIAKG